MLKTGVTLGKTFQLNWKKTDKQ